MSVFYVQKDYETSNRVGAGGLYQLIELKNEEEESILLNKDGSERYDQGKHYTDEDLMDDIVKNEKILIRDIELIEI